MERIDAGHRVIGFREANNFTIFFAIGTGANLHLRLIWYFCCFYREGNAWTKDLGGILDEETKWSSTGGCEFFHFIIVCEYGVAHVNSKGTL